MRTHPLGVVMMAASLVAFAGCAFLVPGALRSPAAPASTPAPATESVAPSIEPTSVPTSTAAEDDAEVLTFAAGDRLDSSLIPEWTDPFATHDSFEVLRADDGNGSWTYGDTKAKCSIAFYQGKVEGVDFSEGDEAASVELLAAATSIDADALNANRGVTHLRFGLTDGTVQFRSIADEPAGQTRVTAARAFGALGRGLVIMVQCPTQGDPDADTYFAEVARWKPLSVMFSPGAG